MEPTKTIFCANCQVETEQVLSVQPSNGEIIATCPCERFIKFPAGTDKETFETLIAEHKTANEGQISVASMEATLDSLADNAPVQE